MNQSELKADYATAYKIVMRERRMREYVFRNKPDEAAKKVGEIDALLAILDKWKDALKEPEPTQPALIAEERSWQDTPRAVQYT